MTEFMESVDNWKVSRIRSVEVTALFWRGSSVLERLTVTGLEVGG